MIKISQLNARQHKNYHCSIVVTMLGLDKPVGKKGKSLTTGQSDLGRKDLYNIRGM